MVATGKLTALLVTRAKKPGMYGDGGGLYLQVTGNGTTKVAKSWIFRYRFKGHTSKAGRPLAREMGLGSTETWSLSQARERARQQRQLLNEGKDPIEVRKQQELEDLLAKAAARTFRDCAKDFIRAHRPGWKNAKHAEQWRSTLERWAYPIIGKLPVSAINVDLVLKVLQQPIGKEPDAPSLWTARTETANRVRGRIENILDWARALKLRGEGENPARWRGLLDKLLPARSTVSPVQHHKALSYADLPRFMTELRSRNSLSARALEFTILTVARTSDTIGATQSEIDREENSWIVPATRLKGKRGTRKRDHIVPLSDRAREILNGRQSTHLLFAHDNGEPLSNMGMLELLQGMGFGADLTVHGFRSTFKDWCAEQTAYPNEMSEMALAHVIPNKVEAAYRRGDMRARRRRLMADWADYCASPPTSNRSNLLAFRAAKAFAE
ncbi:Phage integrase family protein [Bradyrhizobium brasilense]|uniref:Phage integrase family protein n=2 Tax=Bradyrhizobium brasilense TaxID=1419277 RepID=A0A1G6L791_9BRAD|nr:integrase arm-type DNA-binding domain-containing protein [Bradyrhizobium brasilense]SDC38496.1 Phage integrase family protein [Bradyrhizobium brasilense]